jgi:hypothetical protein
VEGLVSQSVLIGRTSLRGDIFCYILIQAPPHGDEIFHAFSVIPSPDSSIRCCLAGRGSQNRETERYVFLSRASAIIYASIVTLGRVLFRSSDQIWHRTFGEKSRRWPQCEWFVQWIPINALHGLTR